VASWTRCRGTHLVRFSLQSLSLIFFDLSLGNRAFAGRCFAGEYGVTLFVVSLGTRAPGPSSMIDAVQG